MKTISKLGILAMFVVVMTTCKSQPKPKQNGQYPTQIKLQKNPTT